MKESIFTCYEGNNDILISQAAQLYLQPGISIADVTWGKGAFWHKVDLTVYNFYASDLKDAPEKLPDGVTYSPGVDFRKLPYADASMDAVVLDPPYAHTPGNMMVDRTYNNAATTSGMYHADIIDLYADGMREALRVLAPGGHLWVKCQDEIQSGKQMWSHIELYEIALGMELYPKDLFVLKQKNKPLVQNKNQQHARKNHSFLWVFTKGKGARIRGAKI